MQKENQVLDEKIIEFKENQDSDLYDKAKLNNERLTLKVNELRTREETNAL